MSDTLKSYTFMQLLQQGHIRIPRIQRGYAQGRTSKKVEDIRKTFLHTLFQVIKGHRESEQLDFVYGSRNANAFEPLDGQQRLTTLFLIHWMLGIDLTRDHNDKRSVFAYASCPTSEDFSNTLVSHDAISLIQEAIKQDTTPATLIQKRDWFQWKWKFDPSISAMLVMIDSIYKELTGYNTDNKTYTNPEWLSSLNLYRQNLNNITFNSLDLGEFGLSNELFIKMNARGKLLSDFDKVKSTLEEEIQVQQSETDSNDKPLADSAVEAEWRTLMDGRWSDYIWHTYARQIIAEAYSQENDQRKNKCLNAAKACEAQFKKLILRLIQFHLLVKHPKNETLINACYKQNESELENLLPTYHDSLLSFRNQDTRASQLRRVPSTLSVINFGDIIKQINSLLISAEDGTVKDVFQTISDHTGISGHKPQHWDIANLMHAFLEDSLPNDTALTFFAALQFLDKYPSSNSDAWKENFHNWVKSLRTILSNNNNNARIDDISSYVAAMDSVVRLTADLHRFGHNHTLDTSDSNFVHKFFQSIADKTYTGLDNQSLKEEAAKSALVQSGSAWHQAIASAEDDSYLLGQIRALLDWANGDIEKLKAYTAKLKALLGFLHQDPSKYYLTALILDLTACVESSRLYQPNFDRDNSFKRYLRDHDQQSGTYAPIIKRVIDLWISRDDNAEPEQILDDIINNKYNDINNIPAWVQCIIDSPQILDFSKYKQLFNVDGQVVIAEKKTVGSHCIDPILYHLKALADKHSSITDIKLNDSKETPPHRVTYDTSAGTHTIQWDKTSGMYLYTKPCSPPVYLSDCEVISAFTDDLQS